MPNRPARLLVLVGALALLVSLGWVGEMHDPIAKTYTNPILLEFAGGAILAWLAPRLHLAHPAIGWGLLAAAVAWLMIAYTSSASPDPVSAHAFSAIAMLAGALVLERLARSRPLALGLFLGDASYSIYLAHPFGQRILYFVLAKTVGVASLALGALFVLMAIAVGLASGAASYLLVERPIISAARKWRHV